MMIENRYFEKNKEQRTKIIDKNTCTEKRACSCTKFLKI